MDATAEQIKVAIDSETPWGRAGAMVPPVVCWSWAERTKDGVQAGVVSRRCQGFRSVIDAVLADDDRQLIVTHNGPYELTGIVNEWPEWHPKVWQILAEGRVSDTSIRERLLNLATHGKLDMAPNLDGSWSQQNYSLLELEKNYAINFGVDRSGEKTDEDAWRNHYELLIDVPLEKWPTEAVDYPKRDAHGTLAVHDAQENRARALRPYLDGRDPFQTEGRQVAADFALRLSSVWGFAIDQKRRDVIAKQLEEELAPDKVRHLIEAGILIPPVPPKLRKNGTWTKGDPDEHIKQEPLHALVRRICDENGIKVKLTATGKVSTDKEVLENLDGLDETLDEYKHRQFLQKLVNTEIPRMSGPVLYSRYDVLKETGRTSCKAQEGVPSGNVQNVSAVKKLKDKQGKPRGEINIRGCYVPRRREYGFASDTVLCSADYSSLEFVSMAQTCYRLFGYSVMRDLLNAGVDPHAYLGGQLALHLDPWFRGECTALSIQGSKDSVYKFFKGLKDTKGAPAELYEKYRKLAKPVGFGYPGGLGAKKFISFAKAQYDVVVTFEEAQLLKEIWFSTYPEMQDFFNWITTECVDPNNTHVDEETGKTRPLYRYVSHLGLVRVGANYTAACNGALLQTPAAEGAKQAVFEVQRACYDPSQNSILYGCRMVAFVHDEIILEIPDDGDLQLRHDRAFELSRIMVAAMKQVMPDVNVKAEPTLMVRWNKAAKMVLDSNGLLDVFREQEQKAA